MRVVGHLSGGAPVLKKYQVNETVTVIGIPLCAGATTEAGLDLGSTTDALDMVGVNYDLATYATAQGTSDPEGEITVNIRQDAIIECRLAGGATSGTALTLYPITTATTDGLDVTTAETWATPELKYGVTWGYDGANAGIFRKITNTSTTAGTVTVAFPNDHQVGDNFLRANVWPMALETFSVKLTSALDEIDATVAVASTNAEFQVIDMNLYDIGGNGTLKSCVLMVSGDHILGGRLT